MATGGISNVRAGDLELAEPVGGRRVLRPPGHVTRGAQGPHRMTEDDQEPAIATEGHDVGVLQAGDRFDLGPEALELLAAGDGTAQHHLQGCQAFELDRL